MTSSSSSSSSFSPPPASIASVLSLTATGVGQDPDEDDDEKNEGEGLNEALAPRNPQHLLSGLSSGLKWVGKGVVGGVVALVAMPVQGAKQAGVRGGVVGLAGGVLGCVGLVGCGATIGVAQFVRGLVNTPTSVYEGIRGEKRWDMSKREWVVDNLEEYQKERSNWDDILQRAENTASQKLKGSGEEKKVADTKLYNVLGVDPAASMAEIKRAYYTKAVSVHPDKNTHPEAKAQFQLLSQAYQVLSDDQAREAYDKSGEIEVEEVKPEILFSLLFGSAEFEPLVGKTRLFLLMTLPHLKPKDQAELQRRREIQIALHLASFLRPHVDGHHEAFTESARVYAKDLARSPFGDQMVQLVGMMYQLKARQALGTVEMMLASMKERFDTMKRQLGMLGTGIAAWWDFQEQSASTDAKAQKATAFRLCELLWEVTAYDVSETLSTAIEILFHDAHAGKEVNLLRAHALDVAGKVFVEVGVEQAKGRNIEGRFDQAVLDMKTKMHSG